MCDRCAGFPTETRRSFLRKLAGAVAAPAVLGVLPGLRAEAPVPPLPGSGWARLMTPSPTWNLHQEAERALIAYIREETPYRFKNGSFRVGPADLEELCRYPFVFAYGLTSVEAPSELGNLREYLCRGGFILTDYCVTALRDTGAYFQDLVRLFSLLLPGAEIRQLDSDHPLFHPSFAIDGRRPPRLSRPEKTALHGVYDDDRMAALISLEHLFCGWPQNPLDEVNALRELTDIYVYARSQSDLPAHV